MSNDHPRLTDPVADARARGPLPRVRGPVATVLLAAILAGLAGCAGAAPSPKATPASPGGGGAAAVADTFCYVLPDSAAFYILPDSAAGDFQGVERIRSDGVTQDEVAYRSGDLLVRGFLFLPDGNDRRPAVIFNHGGVSGVSADMKRRSTDLARLGYVVLAPAYRGEGGSEGVVEVAAGEVDDVLAGAALLARHPRVDGARMAVTGSSHGALISVLAAAREPDLFRCVVEACGVMDVVSWYRYLVENDFDVSDSLSVAVYGRGPEDKPEAFRIRSAIRVADNIRVPVLIQQGLADRIVPPDQARVFEAALRNAGHDAVTRREYPLLGHAFWFWNDLRYHTEDEIAEADRSWADFTAFLDEHLKP